MTDDLRGLRLRVRLLLETEYYRIGLVGYRRLERLLTDALTREEILQVVRDMDEMLGVIRRASTRGAPG